MNSCISIIKAQRAHNNYKNISLKEPNENPQRAHLGPRAALWTPLFQREVIFYFFVIKIILFDQITYLSSLENKKFVELYNLKW